jgi:hypothetical protein
MMRAVRAEGGRGAGGAGSAVTHALEAPLAQPLERFDLQHVEGIDVGGAHPQPALQDVVVLLAVGVAPQCQQLLPGELQTLPPINAAPTPSSRESSERARDPSSSAPSERAMTGRRGRRRRRRGHATHGGWEMGGQRLPGWAGHAQLLA